MKALLYIYAILFVFPVFTSGQTNLVSNGNFEQYTSCPTTVSQVANCIGWRAYTTATPDYFNACHTANITGVPVNQIGYQHAASGNGYCGLAPHVLWDHFEYIATEIQPLQIGLTYEVSMSVNLPNSLGTASDNLGVYFYDSGSYTINTSQILNFTPQIYYSSFGVIADTQNWVRLSKRFIADSLYDNMVIGGFNSPSNNYNTSTVSNGTLYYSYYYIDSVVVELIYDFEVNTNDTLLCAGDTLTADYVTYRIVNSNNIFTLQLSDASGSFNNPINIGSKTSDTSGSITCVIPSTISNGSGYRIRVISSNLSDTSDINPINIRIANPDSTSLVTTSNSPVCAGSTINFSTSSSVSPTTYLWTGPNGFNSISSNPSIVEATSLHTGNYYVAMKYFGCEAADTLTVLVKPIPARPIAGSNTPLCAGEMLNLTAASSTNGVNYYWTGPNGYNSTQQNPIRSNIQFGDTGSYKLAVTLNGCTSDTAIVSVKINPIPFVVIFPTPADSICQGDRVNFTALANNHGGTPVYQWYVNGQASGTGTSFSTTTLNNQDVVRCDMTENTRCSAPYTDPSNDITMNVLPWLAPTVSISVSPNRPLKENEYATFTATATNAGNNPLYQWKRNGQDIVGATGSVWSANTLNDNDSISVEIVSNYKCPQPPDATSNGIVVKVLTGVAGLNNKSGLILYPNPNNGKFVLKGEAFANEILNLEIINAMGQVVYRDEVVTENGWLHKEINVPDISSGIYLLKLQGRESTSTLRFTVQ